MSTHARGEDRARPGGLAHAVWRFALRHPDPVTAGVILAVSVVFAALGAAGGWGRIAFVDGGSAWWTLAFAVPGCLLILAKRRAPIAALAAGAVLFVADGATVGGLGTLLVLLDLLFTASATAPPARRRALLVSIGVVSVGITVATFVATRDARLVAFTALQCFAILATPYWWATAVARAQEVGRLHEQRAADAERLAGLRESAAVREERERMARELHDVVAGHLGAAAIRSEAALASPDPSRDREALAAVRIATLRSHEALRSMIGVLRTGEGPIASPPRVSLAAELVEAAREAGQPVELDAPAALAAVHALGDAVDQAGGRILQESLANAARHAPGAEVSVVVRREAGAVRLRVRSGRPGVAVRAADSGDGMGVALMRERARALGGELTAGPDGDGWLVTAALPEGGS